MNLPKEATSYAMDRAPELGDRATLTRAFMAGALQVLEALKNGATQEQLLAECRQYGRAIGTAAERATN